MTSKKINILIVFSILLFSLAGGFVGVYKYNTLHNLDIAHDNYYSQEREKAEQDNLEDIKISNINDNNNDGNILNSESNSNTGFSNKVDVSNFDFLQMYEHAETILNSATNIYSHGVGSATLSGPTSRSGISLNNEKIELSFIRAQNVSKKYVDFTVFGNLLNGIFQLNYESACYCDNSTYYWFFNQSGIGWQPSTQMQCYDKLRFNTNQTFNIISADSINASTATLFFNKYDQTYTGICELIPSKSSERYAYTLQGVMDGVNKADISSSKMEVVFDKTGKFKSIRYIDEFKINVYNDPFKTTMYASIKSDYTETFSVIGNRTVIINTPTTLK